MEVDYQLGKDEIPDDVYWIHSQPSPGDKASECAVLHILKVMFSTTTS